MKIHNKIALIMIGSILLIANAIPIGRYLDGKQTVNNTVKAALISSEEKSNITKGGNGNAQTLPTNKLSKTSIPWTPFTEIGPSTNLTIKLTGPGAFAGISRMSYFLKYSTWEKKSIIQSNGIAMSMWTAVDHEVTVGGNDSKNIEVAGTKIADTEVRIKSSGAGWAKASLNEDLKWPKGVNPTLANTTYSIDSSGSQFNPNISFYYHIKGYDQLKVASYDVFSFSHWIKSNLFDFIMGLVALCVIIIGIIVALATFGFTTPIITVADAAIVSGFATTEAAESAGITISLSDIATATTAEADEAARAALIALRAAIRAGANIHELIAGLDGIFF